MPAIPTREQLNSFVRKIVEYHSSIVEYNLGNLWEKRLRTIIMDSNEIDIDDIPNEDATDVEIRTWLNNPENSEFLQNVTELDFHDTFITYLPEELCDLFPNIIELSTDSEGFIDYLPLRIGRLTQLTSFDLSTGRYKALR